MKQEPRKDKEKRGTRTKEDKAKGEPKKKAFMEAQQTGKEGGEPSQGSPKYFINTLT